MALFILWVSPALALCVKNANVSLRSGPSSKKPVTWVVPKYTPLIELQRAGGWVQVEDMDGEEHWIYGAHVTNKIVCVAVRVPSTKLRKGPSLQSELADIIQVDKHTPFKRLDIQGEWNEVEAPWGEVYWVHEGVLWRPIRVQKLDF